MKEKMEINHTQNIKQKKGIRKRHKKKKSIKKRENKTKNIIKEEKGKQENRHEL